MNVDLMRLRIWQLLLVVGPLATIAVNPWTNYDPISVVKMFCVVITAFAILGILFSGFKNLFTEQDRTLLWATGIFFLCMLSTLFFSGAPFDQQLWGYFGRNTGLLTYLAFLIVFIGAVTLRSKSLYRSIDFSLIAVSIPVTLYSLVQISGNDPIKWSQLDTFATLGNINFLSGFLGLVVVSLFAHIVGATYKIGTRLFFVLLAFVDLAIILSTGSIQGLVIFAFGSWVVVFLRLKTLKNQVRYQLVMISFALMSGYLGIKGLVNQGPLAKFLYQPSNVLRADYMHAGWQMTTDHPFFGVGMDSYGDWYRQARGEITTLRGSADRNSNAAHSVILDISSNGGFPLLVSYIVILSLVLLGALRAYRVLGKTYDSVFGSLFATWLAFNFQAAISINQIGVAVWGWIIAGALLGYSRVCNANLDKNKNLEFDRRKFKGKLLPAKNSLFLFSFAFVGLVLAGIPQQADSKYFAASKTRNLELISEATQSLGATAWHRNLAIDAALGVPDNGKAILMSQEAIKDYPRSFWPWKVIYLLPESSESDRARSLQMLRQLDPFNPEFRIP